MLAAIAAADEATSAALRPGVDCRSAARRAARSTNGRGLENRPSNRTPAQHSILMRRWFRLYRTPRTRRGDVHGRRA